MNAHDADPLLPEPTDTSVPAQSPETAVDAKPKRKRAVRKPAEAVDAAAADAAGAGPSSTPLVDAVVAPPLEALFPPLGGAPATAPARPKRTRKLADPLLAAQAVDDAVARVISDAVVQSAPEQTASRPEQSPAADEQAPRADADDPTHSVMVDGAQGRDGSEESSEPIEPGQSDQPAPRKSRNRRRGRRGSERAAGGLDGAAGAGAGAGDGEGLAPGADAEGAALPEGDRPTRGPRPPRQGAPAVPAVPPVDPGQLFAEVLSGAFDEEVAADEVEALPVKRVLAAEPDAPKLHKVLAQAGVGSRRDMEQKIVEGRITVNGEPAHTGQRISFGDRIAIDGKPVRVRIAPPPARVIAYHKPVGEVVTHDDPQQRPTVFRRLPRLQQGKWQSVGRLDINTEGLLLFTNSGELANQLMHPRFGVEREYAVRSLGVLSSDSKARLLEGVEIEGQACSFKSVDDGGGEGVNHWYRVVITEGRNREVRRLFEAVGHAVSRLIRIRYGSVVLPRGLKRGVWVDMDDHDLRALRRLTQPAPGAGAGPTQDGEGGPSRRKRRGGRRGGRDDRGAVEGQEPSQNFESREQPPRGPQEPRPPREPREPRPPRAPREAQLPRPQAEFDDDFMPANVSHLSPDVSGKRPKPGRGLGADGPRRGEPREDGAIPNPLQQTYDKRAIQQERALRRDVPEDGPIPNPLQQTYDKRALQLARTPQRDMPDDGPIPNPLQQTYDKRFAQGGGRGPGLGGGKGPGKGGGKGGGKFGKPGGPGGKGGAKAGRGTGGPRKQGGGGGQPDPLKTAVGYIGGDAFLRKSAGGGGGGRGGQRPRTGGGAGGSGLGGGGQRRGGGGGGGGGQGGPGRGGRSR
jgi:23S rRNA pseudouridine2605 synthase